jgi:hypothetical protein
MKTHNFLVVITIVYAIGVGLIYFDRNQSLNQSYQLPQNSIPVYPIAPPGEHLTTYTPMYTSLAGEYEPLNIQCPIPMKDRVINGTGIQCVWSSIEMLGRWAEEPKLTNPPITSRLDCKSYSSPSLAAQRMIELQVRYKQEYGDKNRGLVLIRQAMSEGRGCLFGVPGHAMVLVHFDESANIVKWVDNSDRTLKVQTMTVGQFLSKWDSWVLVIYADNDIVPKKINMIRNPVFQMGIQDRNNPQGQYPRDYIPLPSR